MSTQHQEKKVSEEATQEIESNKNAAQAAAQENLQVLKTRSGNQYGMTRNQDILLDQSVRPEDSISQVNSQASNGSNKSKASSTSSQVKKRLLEETAKRKAIEVQMEALKAEQEIAERRFQGQLQREIEELRMKHRREEEENRLKREEEFLKIKSQLEQATVVERIYAQAQAQAQENQSLVVPSPSLSPSCNKVSLQQAGDNSTSASYDLQETGNNSPPTNTCSGIQVAPVSNGIQVAPVSNSIQVAPATSTDVLKEFLDNLITNQHSNSLALKLPSHEVPIFSGNPLEYTHFIRAFENLIEERTNSESSRLYYLVQYTSGEVKELMQSCLSMKEGEGYQAAKKLLKQRFGQNYKIATAYVERLTRGPAIRSEDSAALQNLSVCLTTCRNVLKDIGYLSQIENPDSLRRIIARLPYDTRKRWRSNVDNIIVKFDREIKLEDIVDFVDRESRIANHPVFGDISDKRKSEVEKKMLYTSKQRGISFATHADSNYESNNHHVFSQQESPQHSEYKPNGFCLLCKGCHHVAECKELMKKTLEERQLFVKSKLLCFNCLYPRHRAKQCRQKNMCKKCDKRHSTVLHQEQPAIINGLINTNSSAISLPILAVRIKSPDGQKFVDTMALQDSGSNATFCTDEIIKQLGIEGEKHQFSLTTMEKEDSPTESSIMSLNIFDLQEENFVELPTVYSRPSLPVSPTNIPSQIDVNRWPHLNGIKIPWLPGMKKIGLLIGNDNAKVMEPKEVRLSKDGGPYACRTLLGWVINGPLGRESSSNRITSNFIRCDNNLSKQFHEFCNQEFNDSIYGTRTEMSQDDCKAISIMENSVKMEDGHYQIDLPWNNFPPNLPNNKILVEHRLNLLHKRLKRDPDLLKKYVEFMNDLLQKGYAEEVVEKEITTNNICWYLPHHPVFHPQKPNKVRVVFDCSARYRNTSLNDQLLQGPNLTNSIVGVLTRFRQEQVAIMGDVEAMFHQVRVTLEHCDALRFLWWPQGDLFQEPKEYRMKVHLFGSVSSPSCCNFALLRTAEDNENSFDAEVIRSIKRNFYVDDFLKSVKSSKEAINMVKNLRQLLSNGGFKLTKWLSNSTTVMQTISEVERATNRSIDLEARTERVLGVQWQVDSDTFVFKISIKPHKHTRRGILSVISSIYDPLGFAVPCILPAKLILQDLCRLKYDWDTPISEDFEVRWNKWLSELPKLEEFTIQRCVKPKDFSTIISSQLHHFSDASEDGYGSVTYLRLVDSTRKIHCSFLIGKSRLTPLKRITIPRLELSAATVSIRLDRMMRGELDIPIDQSIFWTDSTSVLKYINNETKRFQTFVANRISTIRDGSKPKDWRYIGTKLNPGDDSSRGMSVEELCKNKRWIMGPEFLYLSEEHWPIQPTITDEIVSDDPEVKQESKKCNLAICNETSLMEVIFKRFSTWYKLRRTFAYLLRYRRNLFEATKDKGRTKGLACKSKEMKPISVDEIKEAEREILKIVQRENYAAEIKCMDGSLDERERKNKLRKTSTLQKLDPFLKDGLLLVGGRLNHANLNEETKHQVILPKEHLVSSLIIKHYHERAGHSGRNHVLSLIRTKYWIIKGNSAVRRILSDCYSCRRRQGPTCKQKMSDLPENRVVAFKPPFSYVGVDFCGPFHIKQGRSSPKRYVCLFTCLNVRAIHIEVTNSLDTDSFINALRRFISRRGRPVEIRSDNGTNFVGGNRELKAAIAAWNQGNIHNFLLQEDIKWLFNTPAASHHGGVWERCIRTVRKVMNGLLQEQQLNDESLNTLMCEVESVVNSRPITAVSEDCRDLEALTPNHILLMRSPYILPPGNFVKQDMYKRRWRQVQYMTEIFWRRWLKEYLPLLQKRQRWYNKERNLQTGDVILLVDENTPRCNWPIGRIVETFPSQDGMVRKVKIRTKNGTFERPIVKCVLLEGVN